MEHILQLSYGKDSVACLGAIRHLGWELTRVVTADIWATDTVSANFPPVVEFKAKVDKFIKREFGIIVEHVWATNIDGVKKEKVTYEDGFYHVITKGEKAGTIKGFPMTKGPWCQKLKTRISTLQVNNDDVQYLGIAADEPKRIATHINRPNIKLPLVEIGWEEDLCGLWCQYMELLSPTYTTSARDGCWFCHNQGVRQLRHLRKNYPEYWALLLKWDKDSPCTFKPDGHTVHDFERRFQAEDDGLIYPDDKIFRWSMLDEELNYRWF